ncbi:molybdopterin-dependent oxidoreductase Mo/Fe-S-binding subunit [Vibrio sp. SS-MA-C1-2]|uniref:molybdopterin-dependent oxidoreductase Mo/Fe-S-binding subunit n=1 Tax=Vibrio sp. SS-MA-C1-2 TaxID=2908646 RepID=UPI001F16A8C1|nr:molybdopterin-dependent oxidoreductase Mo/Fe-S-binding subunit [Vibrio sp. SS-MA-C1-2]UJF17692.1 molybdopterin-dependent oxidoreductase Mo/Fe-S-binding subunit [Vibrio sp. SS-MA-C1-2]
MDFQFTLNGRVKTVQCEAGENVQKLLHGLGLHSVRDSDNGYGFSGSDAIWFNGTVINASLLIAAQIEGGEIKTAEALSEWNQLNIVQQAMIDVGVIQSGYNDPAAALILTDLFERIQTPNRTEIDDALSGLFSRDAGYQQFYEVVDLVVKRQKDPEYKATFAPEFREELLAVGKVEPKSDSFQMVKAQPCFVEDRIAADSCVMKVLRSPHPHAFITSLDVTKAEALEGVVAVFSYKNGPDVSYTPGGQSAPEPSPLDRQLFGQKMRHVGDRVAAVVAENVEIAEQALALIDVDYEVLPAVISIDDARAEDAPLVHNEPIEYLAGAPADLAQQNEGADPREGKMIVNFPIGCEPRKNIAASVEGQIGDVDKGFAEADLILERTYESKQVQQAPTETHICYAYMDGERVVMHASTQVPFHVRRQVAKVLGIKQNRVHIIKERVGGGFGSKQDILVEDLTAYATFKTGRPVYLHYTREEEFIACSTRHVAKVNMKVGCKKDGTLTAIDMDFLANTGPYGNHSLTVPSNGPALSLPLYPLDNVHFKVTTYYSNICPTGAYQGYGAPKGVYALTMMLAELADELDIDLVDMIEKNRVHLGDSLKIKGAVGEGDLPAEPPKVLSCALDDVMRIGREEFGWDSAKPDLGKDWKVGRGAAIIQQKSGIPDIDQANCKAKLASDGTLIVHSGGADLGTGLDLVVSKIAADVLKMPLDEITVISGDTDHCPFDKGAYASSGTCFSGNAAMKAVEAMRERILICAADVLEQPVSDLTIEYPATVVGKEGKSITFTEIAHKAEGGKGWGQLLTSGSFITSDFAFPYGANFVEVAVNTRTGEIKLNKFHALLDCGTPINPDLALGQIYGASMRAIGHSMTEELVYDDNGVPITLDLKSYGAPKIGDIPAEFKATLVPCDDPVGPFGAKSISEIGVNGAAPAIATAIHDACGVWLRDWHFTPEKVLSGLNKI